MANEFKIKNGAIISGQVGIGTDSPTLGTLQVNGNVYATSFTGSLLGTASYASQALSSSYALTASHATSTAAVAGTTNYVSKFTGATTIGNSIIFDNGTNVGIGTTSPSEKLQVQGNIYASQGGLIAYRTDGNTGLEVNGGDLGPGSFIAKFNDYSNNTKVAILGNGNVGIGTTSPQAKLHSDSDILTGYFQNGTNGIYDALRLTNNTAGNILSGNGARIQFYNNTNNMTNLLGASIRSVNVDYGWASDLVLSSVQNNGYSTQTVKDAIWIKSDGNVGIGTTNPGYQLTIKGTDASATVSSADGTSEMRINAQSGIAILETITNTDLRIRTNSTERMRITSAGDVAVGTTAALLNTSGRGNITINGSSESIMVLSNGGAWKSYLFNNGTNTILGATGDFSIATNNGGTTVLYANTSGNIGIGTTSPGQKLQVGDGTGTGNQYIRIASSVSDIYIGQSEGTILGLSANSAQLILADNPGYPLGIGTTGFQPFILGTQNTERMRITYDGNVGIGTTFPDASAILQIQSTTKGFLPPYMTKTDRDAIASPAKGLIIYNGDDNVLCCYDGTAWRDIAFL